jgi:hypothetical protein
MICYTCCISDHVTWGIDLYKYQENYQLNNNVESNCQSSYISYIYISLEEKS